MLDLGLTKMALIGVVALVVLGPERLPRVARTAGALFGRAQRYINDVKAEVAREIELDGLRQMKSEFETAAHNVENTIHDNLRRHETELNDAWKVGTSVPPDADVASDDSLAAQLNAAAFGDDGSRSDVDGNGRGSGIDGIGRTSARAGNAPFAAPRRYGDAAPARRPNWRMKQVAAPVWYKRATLRRTRVQSGAARVAQRTPATLRRPARFF